jgi:tripartite-type tricarboxylate transporter receptor subunit TctC
MGSGRSLAGLSALALCAVLWAGGAKADPVEDFYRGKSISLIIGSGEGGGYDLSARLVAQHFSDFIPGHPTIVPQNMPAAGSIAAAEYAYSVAPRDGTTLLVVQPTFVLEKITNPTRKYELEKFSYIGRVDQSVLVGLVWHTSPAQSIEDLKRIPINVSAIGAAGTAATIPWALNRMIGTKMRVVLGYDSSAAMGLAMERGETDGNASTSWDYLETKHEWFDDRSIKILFTIALDRFNRIPDVPTILELTDNERDRNALKLIASTSTIGRAIMSTPGVPAERVEALRRAFDRMVKDPQFLADAATRRLGVDPMTGEDLQKIVLDVTSQPQEVIDTMKAAIMPPNQ